MLVLGIESSCDETAAAVVDHRGRVLSDVIASQVQTHRPYGGVVPELAARQHLQAMIPVVREALSVLEGDHTRLEGIAVTQGPGLIGALLSGQQTAKALSLAYKLPLIGINHLVGHMFAPFLQSESYTQNPPAFPFVALLVSGGHTALYYVQSLEEISPLGQTRDDAAGEAFDKAAKLLQLGYPGGPVIDNMASAGNPKAIDFPRPMARSESLEFSFSGLKTALVHHVRKHGRPSATQALEDLCASYQQAIITVLAEKSIAACHKMKCNTLVISGGVAANQGLRKYAATLCQDNHINLHVPPPRACTDNAAMIAYVGALKLRAGHCGDLAMNAFTTSPM